MADPKAKNILIIGGGAVGAIAALNLEAGGLATVTAVLRSNFEVVNEFGYDISSCDHGVLKGWKPSQVLSAVPNLAASNLPPYDYIILTTKNIPDIPPSLPSLLLPSLSPKNTRTVLLLLQNGLNIERPFHATFPTTPILSGVSLIGSTETRPGTIIQADHDRLLIGAFPSPDSTSPIAESEAATAAAEDFVRIYRAAGKTSCSHSPLVARDRWRKLVYNACLNPICAITGLDTGRIRLADNAITSLLQPAMAEIVAAAKAKGVVLDAEVIENTIHMDPLELYLSPSMLADVRKSNFLEFENLVGEPLREGTALGVPMPTLTVLYNLCKAIQWRIKVTRGMVEIPPQRKDPGN
ncbi:2-dehydropantoate 2-reductase [Lepidopterella palustris CBS 459.81]|uniref:2-dehydropantoate 2-reductase n=1 Tax=Lepidopterella palustris CBS 459.81 TaxID=1314670 RepID=A0A8E2E9X2_9PEZI|nr:2-dehydropantoate 2-reductase [Lepidopterella palustris CBS 459.81]